MTKLRAITATCAIVSLLGGARTGAQTLAVESAARRSAAQRVPIGATVRLATRDGQRFKAVLFGVDEEGITVKPATRIPVPAVHIPFDHLEGIDRDEGHLHIGRYMGIGAAVGGILLFVLLHAFD
jgi:hypothetical protein